MIWEENKLVLKKKLFNEKEELKFEFTIKNSENEDSEFFHSFEQNYSLKSLDDNQVTGIPEIKKKKISII